MVRQTSRRDFLKTAALATGAVLGGPFILAAETQRKKLRVAVIGGGGMGGYSSGSARGERFVALCDVDDNTIAGVMKETIKGLPKGESPPRVYHDYRKLLEECHKDLDVVLIATPDHNHVPAAIRAINLGKATFCQKPLAHNIYECRALAVAATKNRVLTQLGNQGHCGEGYRRLVEFIWSGAIGNVKETHSIFDRDFGGQGGLLPQKPVPATLHWDEWLGPAPYRPYQDNLHPFWWRSWRDFGTGTLGDMACHVMDGVYWR